MDSCSDSDYGRLSLHKSIMYFIQFFVKAKDIMKKLKLIVYSIPLVVALVAISIVYSMFNIGQDLLQVVSIYGVIVFTYFAVRVLFHFLNKPYTKPFSISTSMIVPFYNEEPEIFLNCLKSCLSQNPDEVIAIDDGSKDSTNYDAACILAETHQNLVVLRHEQNQGKRHAQAMGFRRAKGDILVSVDSDTVLEKDALKELLKPFIDPKMGAVTGQLSSLNKSDNVLTRILNIRYIIAGALERAAYSYFGVVNCISGPMSAYRRSIILENLDDYLNQTHFGKKCTFGDDRHITGLILRSGYSVFFQKTAKAKTIVPKTFGAFSTQQLRWNRSFWRENWLLSKWMWKRSAYLTLGTILDMLLPFLYFGSLVWTIATSLSSFTLFFLFPFLVTMPLMAFIRNFDYFHMTKAKDYALVPLYSWLYVFLLLPITFFALFTTGQNGWGTR